eukprot:Sdes_comp23555_c0_seq1m21765
MESSSFPMRNKWPIHIISLLKNVCGVFLFVALCFQLSRSVWVINSNTGTIQENALLVRHVLDPSLNTTQIEKIFEYITVFYNSISRDIRIEFFVESKEYWKYHCYLKKYKFFTLNVFGRAQECPTMSSERIGKKKLSRGVIKNVSLSVREEGGKDSLEGFNQPSVIMWI